MSNNSNARAPRHRWWCSLWLIREWQQIPGVWMCFVSHTEKFLSAFKAFRNCDCIIGRVLSIRQWSIAAHYSNHFQIELHFCSPAVIFIKSSINSSMLSTRLHGLHCSIMCTMDQVEVKMFHQRLSFPDDLRFFVIYWFFKIPTRDAIYQQTEPRLALIAICHDYFRLQLQIGGKSNVKSRLARLSIDGLLHCSLSRA